MGTQVAAMLATFLTKMERPCGSALGFDVVLLFFSNFGASGVDFGPILNRAEPILDRLWADLWPDFGPILGRCWSLLGRFLIEI